MSLRLGTVLVNCVDAETDIKRLLQLAVKSGPLLRWNYFQLLVIALKLQIELVCLILYAPIVFLAIGWWLCRLDFFICFRLVTFFLRLKVTTELCEAFCDKVRDVIT